MSCVVDPFTISVKNTVPPVKKTNYTTKKQPSQFIKTIKLSRISQL